MSLPSRELRYAHCDHWNLLFTLSIRVGLSLPTVTSEVVLLYNYQKMLVLKGSIQGAGAMAQWLRALAASWRRPSTYMGPATIHNSSSRHLVPSFNLHRHQAYT